MGKREVTVAYESHGPECAEDCACKEPSPLERRVRELEEKLAARERPTSAHEYVAKDASGKTVFGPTADFQEAKMHAQQARGWVEWAAAPQSAAAEPPPPPIEVAAAVVAIVPEAAREPFTGKRLHWHRSESGASYYADAKPIGRITVRQRTPDRRNGRLPWFAKCRKEEIAQGNTKAEAYANAEAWARAPKAAETQAAERGPGEGPGGPRCASPKDVHAVMKDRYARLGQEQFDVILVNINDEMIGQPHTVAMGQVSGVRVEVEQVVGKVVAKAAEGRSEKGAVGFWCAHNHPGGTLKASPQDKDLTKRIEAARRICAPNMEFKGHLVITEKGWAPA